MGAILIRFRLAIYQSKGFCKSSSKLFSFWCYDVITWRQGPLISDFSLFLSSLEQYKSHISLYYINRWDFTSHSRFCYHIVVMTSSWDVRAFCRSIFRLNSPIFNLFSLTFKKWVKTKISYPCTFRWHTNIHHKYIICTSYVLHIYTIHVYSLYTHMYTVQGLCTICTL